MRRGLAPAAVAQAQDPEAGEVVTAPPARAPAPAAVLRTEFEFELPRGYVDKHGVIHRDGVMRLATARDELMPLHDDRVRENPGYLTIVLLSRVIVRLGTITDFHGGMMENMFASDVAFLQDLYRRINQEGHTRAAVTCPECHHEFSVDMAGGRLGGS